MNKTMRLLNTNQVAHICGVSSRTVAKWLRDGDLKGVKMNGWQWRVTQEEIARFLEEGPHRIQPE